MEAIMARTPTVKKPEKQRHKKRAVAAPETKDEVRELTDKEIDKVAGGLGVRRVRARTVRARLR
jgi:hypothetical protein